MALLGEFGDDYTRTGGGFFTRLGNTLSFIPIVGGIMSAIASGYGTAVEAVGLLFSGQPLGALTALTAGSVSTAVNALESIPGVNAAFWWIQAASGVTTGRSAGTHARKLTEEAIGAVTGVLGIKPTILRSYPAGIGSLAEAYPPRGPGQFASAEAQRRGQDPRAYYASKMNGDTAQHLFELDSARNQPNYQGMGA